jgi:small-conductance mechanosensitive channel
MISNNFIISRRFMKLFKYVFLILLTVLITLFLSALPAIAANEQTGKPALHEDPSAPVVAQEQGKEPPPPPAETAWVVFHGRELFRVGTVSEVRADERADYLSIRLKSLAESPLFRTNKFLIKEDDNLSVSLIFSGSDYVTAVWEEEAKQLGKSRREIAEERMSIIPEAIDEYRHDYTPTSIIKGVLFAILATALLLVVISLIKRFRRKGEELVERWLSGKNIGEFMQGEGIVSFIKGVSRLLNLVFILWLLIVYLNIVLSFFPWTFGIAASLYELIIGPLKTFGAAFTDYLPNLFFLAAIIVVTVYILRAIKYFFSRLESKAITIKGFYSDWSAPTFQLVRIIVIAFAVVAAFPYIPGSSSPAFKGISIFMGVLFSLGSTSAVANIISGLILTYMRPFMVGDQVKVGETVGIVTERRLLSTRIQTPKNELVAIPNVYIVSNHIINYSYMSKEKGLLLHTAITIGYNSPWRVVHDLLIRAAMDTADILKEPKPFVLQTSLEDFYIRYELNAATDHPERRPQIYSELHQNIQDRFAGAGVEIMSPHYRQIRDSGVDTIHDKPD